MGKTKNLLNPQDSCLHDINGREINSPIPAFDIDPIGFESQDKELARVKMLVRTEMSKVAGNHDLETFQEANDFDVEDPFDIEIPDSKYMSEEYLVAPPGQSPPTGPPTPPSEDAGVGGSGDQTNDGVVDPSPKGEAGVAQD